VNNAGVALDAAVTEEWPVAPNFIDLTQVHLGAQYLFTVVRSFGEHASERIGKE
jgi:hypothetical protein